MTYGSVPAVEHSFADTRIKPGLKYSYIVKLIDNKGQILISNRVAVNF